jgi:hypothetical protein
MTTTLRLHILLSCLASWAWGCESRPDPDAVGRHPTAMSFVERTVVNLEATSDLSILGSRARTYYYQSAAPHRFPDAAPRTPATVPCGAQESPPEAWAHPTWQALDFAIYEPHYYSYQFESSGTGSEAIYTAYAFGDIDCDGRYSTFFVRGWWLPNGESAWASGEFDRWE